MKKVSGATTTVYVFSGSKVIAEYASGALPSAPTREYIYSGSQLLAKIEGSATQYFHQDRLSNRVVTDSTGAVIGQQGHYPFGESWYSTGTTTKWQFTSYERDAESGNDYAMFRYHVNRLGRFASPDPIAGSPADPQSLNRYAYVRNDPVNLVDPLGLYICLDFYLAVFDDSGDLIEIREFLGTICYGGGGSAGPIGHPVGGASGGPGGDPPGRDPGGDPPPAPQPPGFLDSNRRQGESFKDCVFRNANEATFGQHDKLLGAAAALTLFAYTALRQVPAPQIGQVPGSPQGPATITQAARWGLELGRALLSLGGSLAASQAAARGAATGLAVTAKVGAVVGAAEIGLLIGSAINCR